MPVWIAEGEKGALTCEKICGAAVWRVVLPTGGFLCSRRRKKLWRRLQAMGVRCAAMAPALEPEAALWGIHPVEAAPLRQALLPQLYEKCTIVTADCAALCAPEATPAVYEAAAFLAERSRYVRPEIARGGEALGDWLRREYGVSAGAAGKHICGGIRFSGQPRCSEVCLGADCRRYQQVIYRVDGAELPEELAALLWSADAVKAGQIQVTSVRNIL